MDTTFQTIRTSISNRLIQLSQWIRGTKESTTEGFQGSMGRAIGIGALIMGLLGIAFVILSSQGAARLSYCYNIALGSSSSAAFAYAVLCFMFPGFQYPQYAVFLHNCGGPTLTSAMTNVATNRFAAITGGFRSSGAHRRR